MASPASPPNDNGVQPSKSTPETSLSIEKLPGKQAELPQIIDLTNDLDDVEIEEVPAPKLDNQKVKAEPIDNLPKLVEAEIPTSLQFSFDDARIWNDESNEPADSVRATPKPTADSVELDEAGNGPATADTAEFSAEQMRSMLDTYMENQQSDARKDSNLGYQEAVTNLDSEAEEAEETPAFLALKKRHEEKSAQGTLTIEDKIELAQAQEDESRRQKILHRKRAYQEVEEGMFISENEGRDVIELPSAPYYADATTPPKKPRTSGFGRDAIVSSHHARYESESEQEVPSRPRGGRRGRGGGGASRVADSKHRVTKPRERKGSQAASKKRGKRGPRARQPDGMLNLPSLWRNDIVGNAQRNQGREEQPGFSSKNKGKALMELLSSIPSKHRKPFAATTKELDTACRRFKCRGNGSMHADAAGGWRLKGMLSSLYHYQLLGAGWMRERETGTSAPYGGLLADSMGYGKTIMTICNIVEGQPKGNAKNKTTLIVCPSSLCNQWLEEIKRHVEPNVLGEVMIYRSGSRVQSADPIKTLTNCAVVITTYHEVMKNYPKCEPPKHLAQEESKQRWWAEYYEENKGPLLQIPWFRVVLDEGHLIKNHEGRTSKACRVLCAKYRWILSGTPLQNGLEELGAFLMFLGVNGAATYDQFKDNYCKKNEKCLERVDALLRSIMIRRTGSDEMFGRPILSLPALQCDTILIDFNQTEKTIYLIVRARFIERINQWSIGGILQKNHRSIWTMLLRLRQMCAHILIVAPTMKDLLETEDLEKLWRLTDRETLPGNDDADPGTVTVFRKMLAKTKATPDPENGHSDSNSIPVPGNDQESAKHSSTAMVTEEPNTFTGVGAFGGMKFKFRKYLRMLHEAGSWAEITARSLCHRCHEPPEHPRLTTPCLHMYCQECLGALFAEATAQNLEQPICLECSNPIQGSEKLRAEEEIAQNLDDPNASQPQPTNNRNNRRGSADPDKNEQNWIDAPGAPLLSSKAQAVTSTIHNWLTEEPDTKIIVFSLFLPMIRVFMRICQRQNWGYCMYVGNMDQNARHKSIMEFKNNPEKSILLASMKAGGLGLNLTMASKCCVVDPWWNESVEDQAWSRIFRIGQGNDVEVKRFMVRDSIDTQLMMKMQERKTKEISRVIGDGRPDKNMSVQDLMKLFGPVQYDPATGAPQVSEYEDVADQFIFAEDHLVQDDSDAEVPNITPARPW